MTNDFTQGLIDACWDFDDAVASEQRFRGVLTTTTPDDAVRQELETQLARALGLQGRFVEARAVLAKIERELEGASARTRHALESGRVLNSSGDREASRTVFEDAWTLATEAGLDGLAVDAAHMLGIVCDDAESDAWHDRAMALCEASDDPVARRWRGSLLNNRGWNAHGRGDFDAALDLFEQALTARIERGTRREVQIALWCVARCLRSLGRAEEALAMQQALCAGPAGDDGYVHEEIAACLTALGREDEAAPFATRAAALLGE